MKQQFRIEKSNPKRDQVLARCLLTIADLGRTDEDFQVKVGEVTRTLDQNAACWATLTDISKQVPWPVTQNDGSTRQATPDDMKVITSACFESDTSMAPGWRGGLVMMGARTSKYSKRKMGDYLTWLHAEGIERGVIFSEKAKDDLEEYARRMA